MIVLLLTYLLIYLKDTYDYNRLQQLGLRHSAHTLFVKVHTMLIADTHLPNNNVKERSLHDPCYPIRDYHNI